MKILGNKREVFIKILKEICIELNYQIDLFSQDWIVKISNDNITNYIIAYSFGINKDASAKICANKTATSEILSNHNVPNVEHRIFHIYDNYHTNCGNWENMINFYNQHNSKVVLKPNVGSSGIGVSFIDTMYKLERETYDKMSRKSAICLSPYYDIINEFRVVMLKNEPQLIFKKVKPTIIGNGKDSVLTLLGSLHKIDAIPIQVIDILNEQELDLGTILGKDEVIELNWKHNLGSGATPEIIEIKNNANLVKIAKNAANALEMNFSSVDIIETKNKEFKVLEVNSGVMLTNFALNGEKGYNLAKRIYKNAIKIMMNK